MGMANGSVPTDVQFFVGDDETKLFFGGLTGGEVSIAHTNNDDFHVFRLVQFPNQNLFQFWRDGVRLLEAETLTGLYADGQVIWNGSLTFRSATTDATVSFPERSHRLISSSNTRSHKR